MEAKQVKGILSFFLSLAMVLSLCSCSSGSNQESNDTNRVTESSRNEEQVILPTEEPQEAEVVKQIQISDCFLYVQEMYPCDDGRYILNGLDENEQKITGIINSDYTVDESSLVYNAAAYPLKESKRLISMDGKACYIANADNSVAFDFSSISDKGKVTYLTTDRIEVETLSDGFDGHITQMGFIDSNAEWVTPLTQFDLDVDVDDDMWDWSVSVKKHLLGTEDDFLIPFKTSSDNMVYCDKDKQFYHDETLYTAIDTTFGEIDVGICNTFDTAIPLLDGYILMDTSGGCLCYFCNFKDSPVEVSDYTVSPLPYSCPDNIYGVTYRQRSLNIDIAGSISKLNEDLSFSNIEIDEKYLDSMKLATYLPASDTLFLIMKNSDSVFYGATFNMDGSIITEPYKIDLNSNISIYKSSTIGVGDEFSVFENLFAYIDKENDGSYVIKVLDTSTGNSTTIRMHYTIWVEDIDMINENLITVSDTVTENDKGIDIIHAVTADGTQLF